jgi:hypothetical protein
VTATSNSRAARPNERIWRAIVEEARVVVKRGA